MTHTELQGVREHGHRGTNNDKQTTTNKQDREASTDRDGERESGSQGVRNARHL
jgi:hypothetical protein